MWSNISGILATPLPYFRLLTSHPVSLSLTKKVITQVVPMQRPRRLSAAFVQTISTPGRYGDGRGGFGLSLLVKPSMTGRVSRSWAQRLRIDGRPANIGLGSFPIVTLARARALALTNARIAGEGGDPRRRPKATPTFAEAMEQAIEVLRPAGAMPGRNRF